jgi:predicted DCC family thiol-disulfide oxidoreductase YuxK
MERPRESFLAGADAWTGGQFSLVRIVISLCLATHLIGESIRGDLSALFLAPALILCFLLAAGALARSTAGLLLILWTWHHGWHSLTLRPELLALDFALLVTLLASLFPAAPFGSWLARRRPDPGGGWHFPRGFWQMAWTLFALSLVLTSIRLLSDLPEPREGQSPWWPSEIIRAPHNVALMGLALMLLAPPLRPVAWTGLLVLFIYLPIAGVDVARAGLISLQLLTFDPRWIAPRRPDDSEILFYDGHCGLCHRFVRFLLAEDRSDSLRFAPLDSDAFRDRVSEERRGDLPDSVVLLERDGRLLVRSASMIRCLERLGGAWGVTAITLRWVPTPIRDKAYDMVAGVRRRLFRAPPDVCPAVPERLRARFEV